MNHEATDFARWRFPQRTSFGSARDACAVEVFHRRATWRRVAVHVAWFAAMAVAGVLLARGV